MTQSSEKAAEHTSQDAETQNQLQQNSHRRSCLPTGLSNSISDGFYLEIVASLSSIALTIVLLVILYIYNDQALPSWPMGITLNALVSLLVTASKTMVLLAVAEGISQYKWLYFKSKNWRPLSDMQAFDAASRGPWGALKMLFSIRPRLIVSLGCLITVLCLALDPFAQQVLVYRTRLVRVGSASVAATTVYDGPVNDTFASVESPMLRAIYSGILEDGTTQPLAPFCATGNCTFDTFESLGFCSECCDVSTSVTRECRTVADSVLSCNYVLPGDIVVLMENRQPLELMNMFPLPANKTLSPDYSSSCDIRALQNSVTSFGVLEVSPDMNITLKNASFCALFPCVQRHGISVLSGVVSSSVLSTWRNFSDNMYVGDPSIGKGEILIWDSKTMEPQSSSEEIETRSAIPSSLPQLITPAGGAPSQPLDTTLIQIGFNDRLDYSAVVGSAYMAEQIFTNISFLVGTPLGLHTDEVVVRAVMPKDTLAQLGYVTTVAMIFFPTRAIPELRLLLLEESSGLSHSNETAAQSLFSTIDYSLSQVPENISYTSPNEATSFRVSQKRFFALNTWFLNALNGTVSQSSDLLRGTVWQLDQITASSDLMSVIYNHGNITKTVQNLATSMSNYIRGNGTEDTVEGAALGVETYVHVRWAWLSSLVACVLLALVFLICAIFSTKRHMEGLAWKSSVLALLFHGLDESPHQPRERLGAATKHPSKMEELAQSIQVRLAEGEDCALTLHEKLSSKTSQQKPAV